MGKGLSLVLKSILTLICNPICGVLVSSDLVLAGYVDFHDEFPQDVLLWVDCFFIGTGFWKCNAVFDCDDVALSLNLFIWCELVINWMANMYMETCLLWILTYANYKGCLKEVNYLLV